MKKINKYIIRKKKLQQLINVWVRFIGFCCNPNDRTQKGLIVCQDLFSAGKKSRPAAFDMQLILVTKKKERPLFENSKLKCLAIKFRFYCFFPLDLQPLSVDWLNHYLWVELNGCLLERIHSLSLIPKIFSLQVLFDLMYKYSSRSVDRQYFPVLSRWALCLLFYIVCPSKWNIHFTIGS